MTAAVVAPLGDQDEQDVVAYVVRAQADPRRHVTYLGSTPTSVLADLRAAAAWRDRTLVARTADEVVVGVLTVDLDEELGRLWWLGPWADDHGTGLALLAAGDELAAGIHEREFAPDARNRWMAELATELGYREEVASAVLVADLTTWPTDDLPARAAEVRPLEPDDRALVVQLHDHLFSGTHTTGRTLVADDKTIVLVVGDPVEGYVATQLQADGELYIDFVGVDPAARGRGLGRALVAASLERAAADGVDRAGLTVRVDNPHARALYAALGFAEERVIAPYRRGFTRDGSPRS